MRRADEKDSHYTERIIRAALDEDAVWEDVTGSFLLQEDRQVTAEIRSLVPGVLAGIDFARAVFEKLDPSVSFEASAKDGDDIYKDGLIATVKGKAPAMLSAERTALNFLQRLSGIATLTRKYVQKLEGTGITVLDTRKTTPMLRRLEKYAVRMGGGKNHRGSLKEMILIKENHIRSAGSAETLRLIGDRRREGVPLEVEADNQAFLRKLLGAPIDRIMLDNFSPAEVKGAVETILAYRKDHPSYKLEIEISGGINLDNITAYAITGVDYISIGSLTHSAPALDMTLEVITGAD